MHYAIGPSKLARYLACYAAFSEEKKYPDGESGPAAIDGTHSHTLLEKCLTTEMKDPMLYLGESLEDHEGKFTVDLDRAKRVLMATNHINSRVSQMKASGPVIVRAEEESNPGEALYWDDWKGTADVTIVNDHEMEVIDYKDGRNKVEASDNAQLKSYALGRAIEYRLPRERTVRMTIIQPRVSSHPVSADITVGELYDFADEVKAWREIAEGPEPPYNPGEKQCKWCKAKGNCAAFNKHALGGVAMQFKNVEVANQAADKEPTTMTDEEICQFVEGIPLLKQAIVAVEEEAKRRFESGHKVPGLKAIRGRGSRSWAFDEEEMAEKLKKMGIPKRSLYTTKLVSPAQCENLSWEKRDGSKKTLSQRQLNTLNKDYIKRKEGKITIVPQAHEGEEVELGVEHLFKPVQQDEPEIPAWLVGAM